MIAGVTPSTLPIAVADPEVKATIILITNSSVLWDEQKKGVSTYERFNSGRRQSSSDCRSSHF